MDTLTTLKTRRSCRKFSSKQVEEEKLSLILEAGTYAPTGMGKQSPIIICVTDKKTRDELSKINCRIGGWPEGFDPFYGASTILIVLADKDISTYIYDGSLVMGNLMNAATAVGVDNIWIHRAKEEFESEEGKQLLKSLGIEGNYEGIGHVALGYEEEGNKKAVAAARKSDYIYYIK